MLLLNLPLVDQGEDQPIHEHRLKDLGHIEVQGEPPEVSGMQEANARVEMGTIYLTEGGNIHHRVTEADQGIEAILWRAASPPSKRKFLLIYYDIECLIITFPDIALNGHQGFGRGLLLEQRAGKLNGIQYILQVCSASQVIADHPLHILHCTFDKLPGEIESFNRIQIMLRLIENEAAGVVMLTGIEGADVISIVIEEMKENLLLCEELQQALVQIHLAKDVKFRGVLHRDIFLLALAVLEGQGVLVSLEFSTGEDVKRLFHFQRSAFSKRLSLSLGSIEDG